MAVDACLAPDNASVTRARLFDVSAGPQPVRTRIDSNAVDGARIAREGAIDADGHDARIMTEPPRIQNMRRRALDAARSKLESASVEEFQMRALADTLGCSVSALYYHFSDKDALLAAVAVEGFQDLTRDMVAAMESGVHARRIEAASIAYLHFMRRHLRLYALMHSEKMLAGNIEAREAERDAFHTFQAAVRGDPVIADNHADDVAQMFWALGRGIASMLLTRGDFDTRQALYSAEQILRGYRYIRTLPPNDNVPS